MTKTIANNRHTETIEAAFPVKALAAAAGNKAARRAIVMQAAESEKVIEAPKPKASEPTNKQIFHSLSPQERRRVMETQSNNISRFLDSVGFKGLELES